jgi:disulfide bond formation protein DsbB
VPNLSTRQTLLTLAAFAAILSLSGFVLEYGFHVLPCHMCWWQRYMHYAILALSLVALVLPRKHTSKFLILITLAAFTGLAIAVWQFAAQHGWLPFPASCTSANVPTYASGEDLLAAMNATKVVPCDKETFTLFGLSLAAWNIPAMLLALALSARPLLKRL